MELISYLEDVFHEPIKIEELPSTDHIPLYLLRLFKLRLCRIQNIEFTFLFPMESDFHIQNLRKQIDKLEEVGIQQPILIIDHMRKERRNRFISSRIAFIEPNRQLYIPYFMNITEWQPAKSKPIERFKKSTQMVFIAILMQENERILIHDMSEQLHISIMSVHRALKDLKSIHIIKEEGNGTKKVYTRMDKKECWRIGKHYMINPIMRNVYRKPCGDHSYMRLSGESALAKLTNIRDPRYPIYAIGNHKKENILQFDVLDVDALSTIEYEIVEIWKYDPCLFTNAEGVVDMYSLYAIYKDHQDPRIQIAFEELLQEEE